MKRNGSWDVRCPPALKKLFPVRRGWWYKVNRAMARRVLAALSRAYKIRPPKLADTSPTGRAVGWYLGRSETIHVYGRAHLKTVIHEFYHHLDKVTKGEYDSNDRDGFAWEFADRVFAKLRNKEYRV